jgi:DNA-binding NtrC family response regulator
LVKNNSASKSKLVAIIDDEYDIIELFRDALGTIDNITIFTFTDPIMALEHIMINKEKYVLVISDLKMPALAGTQFIKKLKNKNRFIRTILMTAFTINDNLFREYAKNGLINGFLQKPIRLDDLRAEVDNQLHAYELQKQESITKIEHYT